MDVPVAIAIAAIYAASLIEALRGGGHVYFDSVSMFVFFLLAGRYLEMRARHRAGDLTDALARLAPPYALRRCPDGALERVGRSSSRSGTGCTSTKAAWCRPTVSSKARTAASTRRC